MIVIEKTDCDIWYVVHVVILSAEFLFASLVYLTPSFTFCDVVGSVAENRSPPVS